MEPLDYVINIMQAYIAQLQGFEQMIKYHNNPEQFKQDIEPHKYEIYTRQLKQYGVDFSKIFENDAYSSKAINILQTFKEQTNFLLISRQWVTNFQNYLGSFPLKDAAEISLQARRRVDTHVIHPFNKRYIKEINGEGYDDWTLPNGDKEVIFTSSWYVEDLQAKIAMMYSGVKESIAPYLQENTDNEEQKEKGFSFIVGASWNRFKQIEMKALAGNATFPSDVRCASFCKRLYDDGFIVKKDACNEQINAFSKERYDLETFGALQGGKKLQREQHMNQTKNGLPPLKYAFD